MFASLSIYGLYEYDDTVFDNLVIPEDMESQRDDLIATILSECSDFALLYPNFDFMKMMIGVWSRNELHIWKRLYESEEIEYNPIENYDRHESITRAVESASAESDTRRAAANSNRRESAERSGLSTRASNTSAENDSNTAAQGNSETTSGQTAYDSDTIKTTGKNTSADGRQASGHEVRTQSDSSTEHTNDSNENNIVENTQNTDAGERDARSHGTETVINHTHGNIGVTTAAQMLQGYREASNFCTLDFIVASFKDRFCVQVY